MKKFLKRHSGSLTELNITPLLDLVIVLLMIFIIAAPQLTNELELSLPSSQPPPQSPTNKPPAIQYILVSPAGDVTLNRQVYRLEDLKTVLSQMQRNNPELNVVVNGHEEADYERVVAVLDILQQAKITHIGMGTEGEAATSVSP